MAPVNLDSVLDDLESEDGNSTTEISNPEEARAETQKVVNLLEQLLLSDAGDKDDGGGAGDGGGNGGTNSGGNAGGGSGGSGGNGGSGGSGGGSVDSSGSSSGGSSVGTGSRGGSGSGGGSSSGVDQGQQQAGAGQSQSDKGIPVTAAPTKPPMSQKEIQRAKVTEVSFRSSGLINGSIVSR